MKTIVFNMSPKGNTKNCNSRIICEEFVRYMNTPCEIRSIADSDFIEMSKYIENFDTVIFILPLYIHAMPGIMMEFIEHLRPVTSKDKSMGFIIQLGFIESSQTKYVERYFMSLAKNLNYNYLGTVSKGEAAPIYMYPNMFKKVLKKFNELGRLFEQTGSFDPKLVKELGKPYELTKSKARLYQFFCDLGLNNFGWHHVLKKNKAFDKRLDRPYKGHFCT